MVNIFFLLLLLLSNSPKEVLNRYVGGEPTSHVPHLKETEPIVWIQSFTGHWRRLEP